MAGLSVQEVDSERALNMIDMIPKNIEVQQADIWKKKDMSKVKDFK